MSKHVFWNLTLTFDLWPWLQSQPSQGQGQPPCQISRSKVKRFSRESVDWRMDRWMDRRMDRRTLPILLLVSTCFAKATRLINMFISCEKHISNINQTDLLKLLRSNPPWKGRCSMAMWYWEKSFSLKVISFYLPDPIEKLTLAVIWLQYLPSFKLI